MKVVTEETRVTLTEAAMQLGISYERAKRLLLTGKLTGDQLGGRWYMVAASSVERLRKERDAEAREGFNGDDRRVTTAA